MNILETANEIINKRSEEKERQYGPIDEGLEKASKISSIILNKEITIDDMYVCLIALKFSSLAS